MAKKSNLKPKDTRTKKVAKKVAAVKKSDDDARLIKPDLARYNTTKNEAGATKIDIGDMVAEFLRDQTLDSTFHVASLMSGISVKDLHGKYIKLNNGMKRMNLGNRIRNFVKEGGYKTVDAAIKDAKSAKPKTKETKAAIKKVA